MKNHTFFISVAFAACLHVSVFAQIQKYDLSGSSNESDSLHIFYKADTVIIGYDSAYVLNPRKIRKYQHLDNYYLKMQHDKTFDAYNRLDSLYSADMAACNNVLTKLQANMNLADQKAIKLAEEVIRITAVADANLHKADEKLFLTQTQLDSAQTHLNTATALIKKERKNRWWKNLVWAGSGAGVALIVKLLLPVK